MALPDDSPSYRRAQARRLSPAISPAIWAALLLPMLLGLLVFAFDTVRPSMVQHKAQAALDKIALDAATLSGLPEAQLRPLFFRHFPEGYLGAELVSLRIGRVSPGVYDAEASLRIGASVLPLIGGQKRFDLVSQAVFAGGGKEVLELALVIDHSAPMAGRIADIYAAAGLLADRVFDKEGPAASVSVVPYNVAVNVGANRSTWIQPEYRLLYMIDHLLGYGAVSGRNADMPINTYSDLLSAPPIMASALFRVPVGGMGFASGRDRQRTPLPEIAFAMGHRAHLDSAFRRLATGGDRRMPVGLMWGWYTLSPGWRGVWDSRLAQPVAFGKGVTKALVLVTGGENNVFLGRSGSSDDNVTLGFLCDAIRMQGIALHVVAYAASEAETNGKLLASCAGSPERFHAARDPEGLREMFGRIAADIRRPVLQER